MKNKFHKLKIEIAENEKVAFKSRDKIPPALYDPYNQTICINQFRYSQLGLDIVSFAGYPKQNSLSRLREDLYHEIMHAVCYFCMLHIVQQIYVPDYETNHRVDKILNYKDLSIKNRISRKMNLSNYLCARALLSFNTVNITELNKQYHARQKKVKIIFCRLVFHEKFVKKIYDQHKIWTEYPDMNPDEFLTEGLVKYFGTEDDRKELRQKEPKLVRLIEEDVIPLVRMVSQSQEKLIYIPYGEIPWRKK